MGSLGSWGLAPGVACFSGTSWEGWAAASVVRVLFLDQSGLGRSTARDGWLRLQVLPSSLPTPTPRQLGWEVEGEGVAVLRAPQMQHNPLCATEPSLRQPQTVPSQLGHSPACVSLSGSHGKVKGSFMFLGRSDQTPELG